MITVSTYRSSSDFCHQQLAPKWRKWCGWLASMKTRLMRLYCWLCQFCCHLFIYKCIYYKVQWCSDWTMTIWGVTCSDGICDPCHMSQQNTCIPLLCTELYGCLIKLMFPEWPSTQDADVTQFCPTFVSLVVPANSTPAEGRVYQISRFQGRYAYKSS